MASKVNQYNLYVLSAEQSEQDDDYLELRAREYSHKDHFSTVFMIIQDDKYIPVPEMIGKHIKETYPPE